MTIPSSGPVTFTDIQTEFGGSNPIGLNEYYAGGSYVPAGTTGTYGAVPSSGQISVQNFYGTTAYTPIYIEDVFSTYLYTGNGTTLAINNGIDLAGKGGLTWFKERDLARDHVLQDTVRGAGNALFSNYTNAQASAFGGVQTYNANGFTLNGNASEVNNNANTYVSWTFREQPKFFDIVTYTGTGSNRTIAHNLGSAPGFIIIKSTTVNDDWYCYHQSLTASGGINLNTTGAYGAAGNLWNSTYPTSTVFSLGTNTGVNQSGQSYVAYLFAHNAGGFGLTGTDNVISCGSYTGDGTTDWSKNITLGYEPQWVLIKRTSTTGNWFLVDTMRGTPANANSQYLRPNSSAAEANTPVASPTATGFNVANTNTNNSGETFIYIAIRRGPMKVPTAGTTVFAPVTWTGTGSGARIITGAPQAPDMVLENTRQTSNNYWNWFDRLRGFSNTLYPYATSAEGVNQGLNYGCKVMNMNGHTLGDLDGNTGGYNASGTLAFAYYLTRAPQFFDTVCYTGTGSNITLNHNLGVVPELMIFKTRTGAARAWGVYSSAFGVNKKLLLNTTAAVANDSFFVNATPTATVFYPGNADESNEGGNTYVAYLFATCAGVSKVGSYTGTSATQTIACGFTGGARFVMIKRTDSTGDWVVWDTGRGMVAGTDPRIAINSTVAETNQNWVYTATGGFQIVTADSSVNSSGGTYIFLAIA